MLIDLHTHTLPRSLDSSLHPADLIARARALGLDGVCLTEHDNPWDPAELAELARQHRFLLLPGLEVSTDLGHLLVFGLERYTPEMAQAARLRHLVTEAGGFMVLAHPFKRAAFGPSTGGLAGRGATAALVAPYAPLVDAVEVWNGTGSPADNAFSQEVARALGKPGTGGSDAHAPSEVGTCVTEFEGRIEHLGDLLAALRQGRFRAVNAALTRLARP